MRVLAALLLVGCGEEEPDPLDRVRDGRVEAALADLAADPPPYPALAGPARQLQALSPVQAEVARVGREMMVARAQEKLEAGDLEAAAKLVALVAAAYPGAADVAAVEAGIDAGLAVAPPAVRAVVLATRASALGASPERAAPVRAAAREAEVGARFAPDRVEEAVAAYVGVTADGAAHLLGRIDSDFHRAPDWAACAAAGRGSLGAMAAAAGPHWPRLADVSLPPLAVTDRASAEADLRAAVAAYGAAGVPSGVVAGLWAEAALHALDPWSRPVWPAEIASWEAGHAGISHGVGLELDLDPSGAVVVDRPLPDAPAWASGIHQGDRLLAMRDDTGALTLDDLPADRRLAVARAGLVGPTGTTVVLTTRRGDAPPTDVAVVRGPVVLETVRGWARGSDNAWTPFLGDGIAYVDIDRFKPTTEAAFDALLDPHLDDIDAVVIDLRGNPGGDINSAVQIADRFVQDGYLANLSGRVLPETTGDVDPQTGEKLAAWNEALPGHALEGTPVAVLVDGDTASAAEVLAGALQERAGAIVVGEPTWGKGEAQALRSEPEHGYAVQFTNVVWATPSRRPLSAGSGIQPDLVVPAGPAATFQLDRLASRRGALRVHADGTPMRWKDPGLTDGVPALEADAAVLTAELALRARLLAATPPG